MHQSAPVSGGHCQGVCGVAWCPAVLSLGWVSDSVPMHVYSSAYHVLLGLSYNSLLGIRYFIT
jgi:hypothetical protein